MHGRLADRRREQGAGDRAVYGACGVDTVGARHLQLCFISDRIIGCMRILLSKTTFPWASRSGVVAPSVAVMVDRVTRGDHAEAALATHDYQCLLIDRGLQA